MMNQVTDKKCAVGNWRSMAVRMVRPVKAWKIELHSWSHMACKEDMGEVFNRAGANIGLVQLVWRMKKLFIKDCKGLFDTLFNPL